MCVALACRPATAAAVCMSPIHDARNELPFYHRSIAYAHDTQTQTNGALSWEPLLIWNSVGRDFSFFLFASTCPNLCPSPSSCEYYLYIRGAYVYLHNAWYEWRATVWTVGHIRAHSWTMLLLCQTEGDVFIVHVRQAKYYYNFIYVSAFHQQCTPYTCTLCARMRWMIWSISVCEEYAHLHIYPIWQRRLINNSQHSLTLNMLVVISIVECAHHTRLSIDAHVFGMLLSNEQAITISLPLTTNANGSYNNISCIFIGMSSSKRCANSNPNAFEYICSV